MEQVRKAALALKLYPKLQLGERKEGGNGKMSVHPTGPHTVKITAEPTVVKVNKGAQTIQCFKFLVEENGQLYKWIVPFVNIKTNEGHYLIDRLNTMQVEVGEEIILEMKKQGMINYIEIRRPGDADATEEEHELPDEEDLSGESSPFAGE